MSILKTLKGICYMIGSLKLFKVDAAFRHKRVAVVGAANSAFAERNGDFIDDFDIVIRLNKAPYNLGTENIPYIGSKTTFLFHSFYENNFSGGGAIDWSLYNSLGIKKVINPNMNAKGLLTHLNFYKRHKENIKTYIISRKKYKTIVKGLEGNTPTVGFSSLMLLLNSECKELYITGFTFFSTPYFKGYRDELLDLNTNKKHLIKQGIHNPRLELKLFKNALHNSKPKKIIFDLELEKIISSSFNL